MTVSNWNKGWTEPFPSSLLTINFSWYVQNVTKGTAASPKVGCDAGTLRKRSTGRRSAALDSHKTRKPEHTNQDYQRYAGFYSGNFITSLQQHVGQTAIHWKPRSKGPRESVLLMASPPKDDSRYRGTVPGMHADRVCDRVVDRLHRHGTNIIMSGAWPQKPRMETVGLMEQQNCWLLLFHHRSQGTSHIT